MKTFKKAKEIFNSQIKKAANEDNFSLKEIRSSSLQKTHSTTRLYKLYLYNKTLKFGLKKLNLFRRSKFKKTLYKVFFELNNVSVPIKKQIKILLLAKKVKLNFLTKNGTFIFTKNSLTKFDYNKTLKNFIRNLNFLLLSNFFEYKISYWLKIRKGLSSFKTQIAVLLKYFKESKKLINGKSNLKNFILKLESSFKKLFINLRWSNKLVTNVMKRIQLVFCIYFLAFLLLFYNCVSCLPRSGQLITKFANLLNLNVNSLYTFLQYFKSSSLIYFALIFKRTNALLLSKNMIGHIGICTSVSLISVCLDISESIFSNLVKSGILLTDLYFCRFFIKTDKKLQFLRHLDIVTRENDLLMHHYSKLFKQSIIFQIDEISQHLYTIPVNRIIGYFGYNYNLGKYEKFIQKLLFDSGLPPMADGSGRFIKSYIYLPFYLIILTSLVYNCCYYIIYNKRPYIPIVSNLAEKVTPKTQND